MLNIKVKCLKNKSHFSSLGIYCVFNQIWDGKVYFTFYDFFYYIFNKSGHFGNFVFKLGNIKYGFSYLRQKNILKLKIEKR